LSAQRRAGLKEKNIMTKTLIATFLVLGISAFAASSTHKVEIQQDSVIEGKTIKAGEYKISMLNGNAVLKMGKETIEVPAHEVTEGNKAFSDELLYKDTNNLEAITIGGTNTRIVFESAASMHPGS
jgi:hypothetical protein